MGKLTNPSEVAPIVGFAALEDCVSRVRDEDVQLMQGVKLYGAAILSFTAQFLLEGINHALL